MENTSIEEVIQELERIGGHLGIEVFEIQEFLTDEIPAVQLGSSEEEPFVETQEEAFSKVHTIMRLTELLEPRAIFYKSDTNYHNNKIGYTISIYIIQNSINYSIIITSLNYFENISEKSALMDRKLRQVREAIEGIFKNEDFDPDRFVENSLIPYLNKNNIDYKNNFFNMNQVLKGWLTELLEIEDFASLVDELFMYYGIYENNDEDYSVSSVYLSLMSQIVKLIPQMYKENQYMEKADLEEKINNLVLAIHIKTRETAMRKSGSDYVRKITDSFLNYRKTLGIKNPKTTKEEIDAYLRTVSYDTKVPRELLKNAMFDLLNEKEYN